MTALERAELIAQKWQDLHIQEPLVVGPEWLVNEIHRACIEHSNEELERRRKVEARIQVAAKPIRVLVDGGELHAKEAMVHLARTALKALEGGDA